jgi:uncharacterized membrane protein
MFGLTPVGTLHTAISLVAVIAGVIAFFRDKEISPRNGLGRTYLWSTLLTCITSFAIFEHGGFGKPHALAILTVLVLGVATLSDRKMVFGRLAPYVATVSYSLTFFFHVVPGLTETFTRLPAGSPLFSSPEDPELQKAIGLCFGVFLLGAFLQVRRMLRLSSRPAPRLAGPA